MAGGNRTHRVYEVESVKNRRVRNGNIQYLLKWKNYSEMTWTDSKHCTCSELIAKYEKELQRLKRNSHSPEKKSHKKRQREETPISPITKADLKRAKRSISARAPTTPNSPVAKTDQKCSRQFLDDKAASTSRPTKLPNHVVPDRSDRSKRSQVREESSLEIKANLKASVNDLPSPSKVQPFAVNSHVRRSSRERRESAERAMSFDRTDIKFIRTAENRRNFTVTYKEKSDSEEDSEEEFDVEIILKERMRKGKLQYLIKWAGYDEISWANAAECQCQDKIEEYERKKKEKASNGLNGVKDANNRSKSLQRLSKMLVIDMKKEEDEVSNADMVQYGITVPEERSLRNHTFEDSTSLTGKRSRSLDQLRQTIATLLCGHLKIQPVIMRRKSLGRADVFGDLRILQKDQFTDLRVWTLECYMRVVEGRQQESLLRLSHADPEHFLGREIDRVIAYVPVAEAPFCIIKLLEPRDSAEVDILDSVRAVECRLAASLFPKAFAEYSTFMALSYMQGSSRARLNSIAARSVDDLPTSPFNSY